MLDTFMPLDRSAVNTGFDPAFPGNYMQKPISGDYAGVSPPGVDSFSSYLEQVMGKDLHTDAYAARDAYRYAPVDTEPSPYREANAPDNSPGNPLSKETQDQHSPSRPARPFAESRQAESTGLSRESASPRRSLPESGDERLAANAVREATVQRPVAGSAGAAASSVASAVAGEASVGKKPSSPSPSASRPNSFSSPAYQGRGVAGSSPRSGREAAAGAPSSDPRAQKSQSKDTSAPLKDQDSGSVQAQKAGSAAGLASARGQSAGSGASGETSTAGNRATMAAAANGNATMANAIEGTKNRFTLRDGQSASKADDPLARETGRDRRKERLEVRVADLRADRTGESASVREGASGSEVLAKAAASGSTDPLQADSNGADIVIRLSGGEAGAGTQAGLRGDQAPLSRPGSFANALAQELRAQYNGDIVRHASIVLKNGGDGLIRLALQPGHLGDVKIQLKIADNNIAARIVVKSEEALKAFESELSSLRQAFIDGGFDGASLELSVSADGAGQGQGGQGDAEGKQPFYTARLGGRLGDRQGDSAGAARALSGSAEAQAGYEALSVVEADEAGVFAGASRAGGVDYQSGRLRRINVVI